VGFVTRVLGPVELTSSTCSEGQRSFGRWHTLYFDLIRALAVGAKGRSFPGFSWLRVANLPWFSASVRMIQADACGDALRVTLLGVRIPSTPVTPNRILPVQTNATLGNCASATACYVYDAEGRRADKTTSAGTVQYLYDLAGHQIGELNVATGAWNRGEIYAGALHLATYPGNPGATTYFTHADWLGTERVRSNLSSSGCEATE